MVWHSTLVGFGSEIVVVEVVVVLVVDVVVVVVVNASGLQLHLSFSVTKFPLAPLLIATMHSRFSKGLKKF